MWPDTTTVYTVVGTTASGCVGSDSVTVVVRIGIDEVETIACRIYPNPTSKVCHIEAEGMKKVCLYNTLGQCVECVAVGSDTNKVRIETAKYASGTYLLRIEMQDQRIETRRISITR